MSDAIDRVAQWVDEVVVGLGLCPFAARPLTNGQVRWVASDAAAEDLPEVFIEELQQLIDSPPQALSTTLIVLEEPGVIADFELFLDIAFTCEEILDETGANALVQLATFHPDYIFEGSNDAAANATHRAPLPVLHLLRVQEVEEAIARHADIPGLLTRNRDVMRHTMRQTRADVSDND